MKLNVTQKDLKKTGVYSIKNLVNGKFYVGSTSNSFYNRYHQHLSDFRKEKNTIPVLHRAFRKHGIDNFEFSILCICQKEDCIRMEQFYLDNGTDYNSAMIAGSMLNYKHPKNSKTRTIIGGLHHCAMPVYRFTLEGEFDREFSSFIEALQELNKDKGGSSHIKQCCLGKTFSAFGYRWSLDKTQLPQREKRVSKNPVKIILEKDDKKEEFTTQVAASDFLRKMGFKCNQARIQRSFTTGEKVYGFKVTKKEAK